MSKTDDADRYVNLLEEVETLLYDGIEAFERIDLIRIRQCASQITANVTEAWKIQRKEAASS